MQIGLCTLTNEERPVESVVRTAGEVGYDGVEIWGRDGHVGDGTTEECRSIRDAAEERDLDIPVYGSYLRAGDTAFDDSIEHELRIADRLDADLVRVWAGSQEYGSHDEEHWDQVVDDLRTVADRAAERDLGVTVEKHANSLTNDGDGAERLIRTVGRENCSLNWQPAFSLPHDALVDEAERLVSLTNNVHVQAVPEPGSRDRCLLEDAYFDVDEILGVFVDHDFSGSVNVEFVTEELPYEEAIRADLEYIRTCVSRSE